MVVVVANDRRPGPVQTQHVRVSQPEDFKAGHMSTGGQPGRRVHTIADEQCYVSKWVRRGQPKLLPVGRLSILLDDPRGAALRRSSISVSGTESNTIIEMAVKAETRYSLK